MNVKRWLWPTCKILITLIIVVAVGWQFANDLQRPELQALQVRPIWLLLSSLLYVAGLSFSGVFWYRLLWRFGEQPQPWPACRAYFVGHLGKYVPGKAVALLLRASLMRGPRVRLGIAILSAFYEVLTTMAAGALLAAAIFTLQPPRIAGLEWNPVFIGLLLLAVAGIPVLPGVFNRVVGRLAARFETLDSLRLPRISLGILLGGLLLATCGWLLLGLSLWCALNAVAADFVPLTWSTAPQLVGAVSLSYVAGFLALVVPGGIGVREILLLQVLRPMATPGVLDDPAIALAILLLRLVWTATEVILAGILYFVGRTPARSASEEP